MKLAKKLLPLLLSSSMAFFTLPFSTITASADFQNEAEQKIERLQASLDELKEQQALTDKETHNDIVISNLEQRISACTEFLTQHRQEIDGLQALIDTGNPDSDKLVAPCIRLLTLTQKFDDIMHWKGVPPDQLKKAIIPGGHASCSV
ncbi:MAG: hypothetical protein LBJ95_01590 [Oscillospiraceae bacterium]|jgi:septal ring factor EnvC (AmiA/AmiB activator)|nr:hypothetical protein [Oscillospiraceae bacterium]